MAVAVVVEHFDDIRDDVAGPLDADAVAHVDAEVGDERGVMQRGTGDGDAADLDGVHERDRGEPSGPADLHDDVPHRRLLLAGRELVGEGPPWGAGGRPEVVAGVHVVDLDDDAVDFVIEVVAGLLLLVSVVDGGVDVVNDGSPVTDPESPLGEPLVQLAVALEVDRGVEDAEEEYRQRALGGHRRVELAERPGGGVAGVREGVLAALDALAVERREASRGMYTSPRTARKSG